MEKYEKQLTGEYLEKYEEIEALCQNLSFFMNDDDYYKIVILNETLDLLLEAQQHHQPVSYVLGHDLQKFIYLRYKECSQYSFSYGNMGIIFFGVFCLFKYLFPNAFTYHLMETEYYVFLLLPLITKFFYFLNQNICLNMFFRLKKNIRESISYGIFGLEMIGIVIIVIQSLFKMEIDVLIYNVLFFSCVILIIYSKRQHKEINFFEWFNKTAKSHTIYTLFVIELIIFLVLSAWFSHYLWPLVTTGTFQWFIPTLVCVLLTTIPLKGLNKKSIHYHCDVEELLDQYLSHCFFLITKRKMTNDIPLTYEDYFVKLQKKHHYYKKIFFFHILFLLISFMMFMTSFQFSLFYFIIIGYFIFGVFNLYKYGCIFNKIDQICDMAETLD